MCFAPMQWSEIADFRFFLGWLVFPSLFVLERVLQKSPFHTLFMSSFPTSKSLACLANMCFAPREVLHLVNDVTLLLTVRFVLGSYTVLRHLWCFWERRWSYSQNCQGKQTNTLWLSVFVHLRPVEPFPTTIISNIATKIGNIHTGVTSTASAIL